MSTEQTGKAAEQEFSTSIQIVAEGGIQLVSQVETANKALSSITQAVSRVVTNTKELLEHTEQVNKISIDGLQTVQKATRQMEEIQSKVGASSNSIQALGETIQSNRKNCRNHYYHSFTNQFISS